MTFANAVRDAADIMRDLYLVRGAGRKHGYGYIDVPRWVRWILVYVGSPLFAAEQYWIGHLWHRRGWPVFYFGDAASRLLDFIHRRLERFMVSMRYNPSLGEPHEIGFWSTTDGSRKRTTARWYVSGASNPESA